MLLISVAVISGIAILAGCPSSELGGVRTANVPPWVKWSNTPQDLQQHSANPELFWFGSDEDGQIIGYEYVVLLEEDVDAQGGIDQIVSDFPESIEWNSLGEATEAVIPLFASEDTSEYVDQYVFLRCVDDKDTYSEIISLFLSRNNHPPTCIVTVPLGPRWCLPDTNEFWDGIDVSWEGKDSLDYESIQPDFLWHVRLYGPFAIEPDLTDTLMQNFYDVLLDEETGLDTVTFTSFSLTNLQTGWYILYVKNFDDAHVASIPALGIFEVYEPKWIRQPEEAKDILIVDQNRFRPFFGELPRSWEDSVEIFFENLMADAGYDDSQWEWAGVSNPPISTLYQYRLVIITDVDFTGKVSGAHQRGFTGYLDVGGKLWIIGRETFAITSNTVGLVSYGLNDPDDPLPYTYMGFSAAMFPPGEDSTEDGWGHTSEFSGAQPLIAGFPTVDVDTNHTLATTWEWPTDPTRRYEFRTLPRVEYVIRNLDTETIYTFVAVNPDTSRFHGFPVAVRYESSVFKTSYFAFHLFFAHYDNALAVTESMLAWFLDE